MNRKTIVIALVIAFAFGGWIGDESRPKPDRPVARFIGRIARLGMWLMVLGEPQPQQTVTQVSPDSDRLDHMRSL